jgi:hypothetical protein
MRQSADIYQKGTPQNLFVGGCQQCQMLIFILARRTSCCYANIPLTFAQTFSSLSVAPRSSGSMNAAMRLLLQGALQIHVTPD